MDTVNIPVTVDELVALWNLRHGNSAAVPPPNRGLLVSAVLQEQKKAGLAPRITMGSGKFQYNILGEQRRAKNSITAYLDILTTLFNLDSNFPERLSEVAPANTRNHIARSREGVYPLRPDLCRKARMFAPGWYAGTNIADREKRRILVLACQALGLEFDKDIQF